MPRIKLARLKTTTPSSADCHQWALPSGWATDMLQRLFRDQRTCRSVPCKRDVAGFRRLAVCFQSLVQNLKPPYVLPLCVGPAGREFIRQVVLAFLAARS